MGVGLFLPVLPHPHLKVSPHSSEAWGGGWSKIHSSLHHREQILTINQIENQEFLLLSLESQKQKHLTSDIKPHYDAKNIEDSGMQGSEDSHQC